MTPKLWTWVEGVTRYPSMVREKPISPGFGFVVDDNDFGFIAVWFQEVSLQLGFDIGEAICQGDGGGRCEGFSGEVELCVIGIAVNLEAMVAYNLSKGEHIEDK